MVNGGLSHGLRRRSTSTPRLRIKPRPHRSFAVSCQRFGGRPTARTPSAPKVSFASCSRREERSRSLVRCSSRHSPAATGRRHAQTESSERACCSSGWLVTTTRRSSLAACSPPGVGVKMTRRSVALSAVRIWRSTVLSPTSWLSSDVPAPARPDRHRSLHQHPSDRLIRHAQVLTQVVQRPSVLVEDDSFVNLRIGHHRPRLAPTGSVPGDRRAMEVVDPRQLADRAPAAYSAISASISAGESRR